MEPETKESLFNRRTALVVASVLGAVVTMLSQCPEENVVNVTVQPGATVVVSPDAGP